MSIAFEDAAVAFTPVGALGAPGGVVTVTVPDGSESPPELVAKTRYQ
jgi:hypothetical protein